MVSEILSQSEHKKPPLTLQGYIIIRKSKTDEFEKVTELLIKNFGIYKHVLLLSLLLLLLLLLSLCKGDENPTQPRASPSI